MWKCKHCEQQFDFSQTSQKANHSRWCAKNPKSQQFRMENRSRRKGEADIKFGKVIRFNVICSKCDKHFSVREREHLFPCKERYFCSRKCSNSIGGSTKALKYYPDEIAHYSAVCFRHHEKKCVVCGESKIVAVHHFDGDHSNNDPKNLVPLCPTHHCYIHSRYAGELEQRIKEYVKNKWK